MGYSQEKMVSKGMEYGVDYGLSQCHGFESEAIPLWTSDSM